jgi:hypothetical protein
MNLPVHISLEPKWAATAVAFLLSSRAIAKDLTFLDDRAAVVRFLARLGMTT